MCTIRRILYIHAPVDTAGKQTLGAFAMLTTREAGVGSTTVFVSCSWPGLQPHAHPQAASKSCCYHSCAQTKLVLGFHLRGAAVPHRTVQVKVWICRQAGAVLCDSAVRH